MPAKLLVSETECAQVTTTLSAIKLGTEFNRHWPKRH